jgi:hypothetical protein
MIRRLFPLVARSLKLMGLWCNANDELCLFKKAEIEEDMI